MGRRGGRARGTVARIVRAVLTEAFDTLDVPGLGFAVVSDGEIVEAGGLGAADAATGRTVDAATRFRVGSLHDLTAGEFLE